MLNNYNNQNVRTDSILTTSYVAGHDVTSLIGNDQLVAYIDLTLGSLTSAEVKIEFLNDGEWYQETFESIASGSAIDTLGEHVFTADGKYRLLIDTKDSAVRISAKGTGTVTGSSMAIKTVVGTTSN